MRGNLEVPLIGALNRRRTTVPNPGEVSPGFAPLLYPPERM